MEPSTEVSAATQPVVKLSSQNNASGENQPSHCKWIQQPQKFQGNHELHVYVLAPTTCPSMKEGPISQWDSTTTNPPHWSGDMYQEQLNRPTTHWCQPLPLSPPLTPPLLTTCPLLQVASADQGPMGPRTTTPLHCNHTLCTFGTCNQ